MKSRISSENHRFSEEGITVIDGLEDILSSFSNRVSLKYGNYSTVRTYRRSVRDICLYHGCLLDDLELDEILDYLNFLKERGLSWAKIKLDVAGLKFYYRHVLHNEVLSESIPYPKEVKSLPKLLSRSELLRLFDGASNPKHRLILRLIYGSGLRRSELINLKLTDIETDDGKCRIRINNSKGGKDRYTVLSKKVLEELRAYYKRNYLSRRVDKKYCNAHCKSAYHYVKTQELAPNFFNKVDNQLRLNRRILKQFNKAIMAKVG